MKFYSQFGEDKWIWENLMADGKWPMAKTFCEVGAFDGVNLSNTKFFEDEGWRGIIVEPIPFLAARCQQERQCPVWCCAVGLSTHGEFSVNIEHPDLSGLQAAGHVKIPVLIQRLFWLLMASNIYELDLLSIDTEGTELDVWESRGIFRPRVVVIEHLTGSQPSQATRIRAVMDRDGYEQVHETRCNLIFVRKEIHRRDAEAQR